MKKKIEIKISKDLYKLLRKHCKYFHNTMDFMIQYYIIKGLQADQEKYPSTKARVEYGDLSSIEDDIYALTRKGLY